jgi:hypothetical protein
MHPTIEEARQVILSCGTGPTAEAQAAVAFLNEYANEHWAWINGSWHHSHFIKESITISPLSGEFFGEGSDPEM